MEGTWRGFLSLRDPAALPGRPGHPVNSTEGSTPVTTSLLLACALLAAGAEPRATVIVVVGAEGTPEYGRQFRSWANRWQEAARRGNAEVKILGLDKSGKTDDRVLLQERLTENAGSSTEPLWLILIGHGTFDGKIARFNLRGPDVSAGELAQWLKPVDRPLAVVNCASSSGPFINELSGPNRVVITATRSGHETSFARFGDYLSSAVADPRADLDKDEQVSLLEAYLLAAAGVREFYAGEGRLASEHALIDDNGDRLGTPPDWFKGVRAVKTAKNGARPDGVRAGQWHLIRGPRELQLPAEVRRRRDQLEQDLAELREHKAQLAEDEYFGLLEPLLVELARLYEASAPAEEGK
jgi:hypothetical protein